ncbi:MAG: hypothetical protein WCI18_03200 [Pseudomonadota bacterium]
MSSKKYDQAIKIIRGHLRKNPKDFNAWSILGVAYYHTGQARQSLKYLKYAQDKAASRATNHFYQGLCYQALGNKVFAERYFEKLSFSKNQWTEAALVELVMLSYHDQNTEEAKLRLKNYFVKFPRGSFFSKMILVKTSLDDEVYDRDLVGYEKPNLDAALFKYSPLSLMSRPHFWYLGFSGGVNTYSFQAPKEENGKSVLVSLADQDAYLNLKTAAGIGPIKQGATSFIAGYSYDQVWMTTSERLDTYQKDPTDFAWQPFRTDLMQRDHQFYLDLKFDISKSLTAGLYTSRTYSKVGSSLAGPESSGIDESLPLSDETLVTPWIGFAPSQNVRIVAFWYFEKFINYEFEEISYKTYSFEISSLPLSLGVSASINFPNIKANLRLDGFHYELIYNDPYLDNSRNGGMLTFSHTLFPTFEIAGSAGIYVDTYIENIVKSNSCRSTGVTDNTGTETLPQFCARKDNGLMFSAQASWGYTQFNRVFFAYRRVSNQNPSQKENQFEKNSFFGGVSLAFPSMNKVLKYIERFADRGLERAIR